MILFLNVLVARCWMVDMMNALGQTFDQRRTVEVQEKRVKKQMYDSHGGDMRISFLQNCER